MIEIKEVKTRKQKRQFVDFPVKLYKGVWNYVPALRVDELSLLNPKKNVSYDVCDMAFFLAYKDGKVAGRICGIIQKQYNEKMNCQHARFSRFDCIDDSDVAHALFECVEGWAKSKGMDTVHGPLGFNDLDREGLIVDGYDQPTTFEENYSFPYYARLIEENGYTKEKDWVEYAIYPDKKVNERVSRLADTVMQKYDLHIAKARNIRHFIKKYGDDMFDVIDVAYRDLLGVVPFTDRLKKQTISQFKLFLNMNWIIAICDKNDRVIAFGLGLPSIAKVITKSRGRILSPHIFSLLHTIRHPRVVDLGLEGVRPEYVNKGVNSIIVRFIQEQFAKFDLEYLETNLNLEDNLPIQQQWRYFDHRQTKRRRCYIKKLQ